MTSERAQYYIALWRRVIVDLLGRSERELNELIRKWHDGLMDENSMFYHEAPEYYVAPVLVPESLARTLLPYDWFRLCWAIYPVIGRYDRECGLAPKCFDALRRDIDQAIAAWLEAHQRKA